MKRAEEGPNRVLLSKNQGEATSERDFQVMQFHCLKLNPSQRHMGHQHSQWAVIAGTSSCKKNPVMTADSGDSSVLSITKRD